MKRNNFIINKEPIKRLLSPAKANAYYLRRLSTKILKKYAEIFNSMKRYFQISKSELDFYYQFSPRLRRRNSFAGLKKYIPPRIHFIRSSKSLNDNKKTFKFIKLDELDKENLISAEKMNQILKEKPSFENVEQRINFLMRLNPFYDEFNKFERHSEAIITAFASEYKGKIFNENQIVFRYGDENNDFYLIHKGKVNIYCPFTESLYMNIDEFYIYLLRLRRYNEIEMLNDVLLMNNFVFMRSSEEQFNFDRYVLKLYNTFIKLKFVPDNISQRELKKYIEISSNIQNNMNNNNKNNGIEYINLDEYNNIIYKSFKDIDIQNLVLRIEDELVETMLYINPDEMKQIIKEQLYNGDIIKRIIKMPNYLIYSLKKINPDEANASNDDYIKRISPKRIINFDLQKQKVTIMKYIFIKTLSQGEYFGEFIPDSNEYFSPKLIRNMHRSKLNVNIHEFEHYYNVTAIAANDISYNNPSGLLYLGHLRREYYNQYLKKFVEKMELPKKKFILNNRLFKNTKNANLVKTYTKCFRKKSLKENECLISEKDELKEDNTFIYFILKGEFQSFCNQTVESLDRILKKLDCEEELKQTIPIKLNKIKDTYFFEEICKKDLKIRLSYLSDNDIVGLSENIFRDKYFNSVYCISKEATVYFVDSRIIQLFIEGCNIIRDNKNALLIDKYKVLTDLLLKQRKSYLDTFCTFQIDSAQEKESNITTNLMKRDNLFKQKNSYSRILSSQTSKNGQLKLRNNDIINEPIIKSKKYFSLGSVCEVLTKDYKGTTFEFKRKEKSMIFKKKYLEKTQKQKKSQSQQDKNKELSMTMNILQEIEEQKTNYVIFKKSKLNTMKSLKSHKSCSDMLENYRQNKIKNSPKNSNLIIIKNFFKKEKEDNKQNRKDNNNNENISDLAPLSYDSLWKKNFGKNGCYNKILKVNDFFKNIKNKGYRINNIRLSKLKEIKSDRNKLLKHKLRNLYYSDFEKILLSERLKY